MLYRATCHKLPTYLILINHCPLRNTINMQLAVTLSFSLNKRIVMKILNVTKLMAQQLKLTL
jgi:hypothetical protein